MNFAATFLTSDHAERDPYSKLTVGLSHAFGGTLLVMAGLPLMLVVFGYFVKEVIFDLARVFVADRSKWLHHIWRDRYLVADSLTDWCFWWLGAAMVAHNDARYGFAVLIVGAAYFAAGKLFDGP